MLPRFVFWDVELRDMKSAGWVAYEAKGKRDFQQEQRRAQRLLPLVLGSRKAREAVYGALDLTHARKSRLK